MADKRIPKPGDTIGHPLGNPRTSDHDASGLSLVDVIGHANEVKMALEDRKPLTAWKHTLPIQEFLIDTGMQFGIQSEEGEGFDKKEVKELEKVLKQCVTLANKIKRNKTKEGEVEVQKFGDGVLLGKLLDLLKLLLPILLTEPKT